MTSVFSPCKLYKGGISCDALKVFSNYVKNSASKPCVGRWKQAQLFLYSDSLYLSDLNLYDIVKDKA